MSSSDSSAVSMTSLDTSIPLQKPVSMPSQAQQHSWNTTPACQPPRTTSSRPPTLHQNRGAIQHHTQLLNLPVQQPCLPLITRPCKRELDSSLNEPASKRHQTTAATSDNDFELCDLVIDISPESVSEPNISSNATQHASTRQHMSSHNNHSSIDSNISAEDVFTQPIVSITSPFFQVFGFGYAQPKTKLTLLIRHVVYTKACLLSQNFFRFQDLNGVIVSCFIHLLVHASHYILVLLLENCIKDCHRY